MSTKCRNIIFFLCLFGAIWTMAMGDSTPLSPWQVTRVNTHSPSGYAGNPPYCTVFLTISDPNAFDLGDSRFGRVIIPASTTNCSAMCDCRAEKPYNTVYHCDITRFGLWTFQITSGGTEGMDVNFTLVNKVSMQSGVVSQTYTGQGHFEVGQNMGGSCGGSGTCSWWLKENLTVPIEQKLLVG